MRLESEFLEERNRDLLHAYRKVVAGIPVETQREALQLAVNSPSARFWVTAECTTKAINRILRGDMLGEIKPLRREMFFELYRKFLECRKQKEFVGRSVYYISAFIIEEPAPKFYLAVSTAMKLFTYQVRKDRQCRRLRGLSPYPSC